jgi:hypothetical protein
METGELQQKKNLSKFSNPSPQTLGLESGIIYKSQWG